ncbi:MAG: hypothetical protein ABIR96_01295 [Bdellovibrionota bacterium]
MNRSIFMSQSLDHLIPLLGCLLLLILTPLSLGYPLTILLPQSPMALAMSIGGALLVSSLCYRTLCVVVFGRTLGMHLFGLMPRKENESLDLIVSHLWEALSLACPILWVLDFLARNGGKRIGFDYVFCYKQPL